jgi:hypothetical protein
MFLDHICTIDGYHKDLSTHQLSTGRSGKEGQDIKKMSKGREVRAFRTRALLEARIRFIDRHRRRQQIRCKEARTVSRPVGGDGDSAMADTKAMELDAADAKASSAAEPAAVPSKWLPTASELKPALDALWRETSLLPDLNAIIAGYADLQPRWTTC